MQKRETELDILRITALLMVILVHVCSMQIRTLPATDTNWQILVLLQSLVTWEVPVFIMISGRFFLDPERDISFRKVGKAIWRLAAAFVLWDIVYQIYYITKGTYADLNWKGILSQAIDGPFHFWYLWMLAGMYAITPFLRKITGDKKLMEYFIVLYLAMQLLTQYGPRLPLAGPIIDAVLENSYYHFTLGYTGYYILGYYLRKYPLPDKAEKILYAAAAVLLAAAAAGNLSRSVREGTDGIWYIQYQLPNIAIEAAAVYTFAVKRLSRLRLSGGTVRRISALSGHSFGVYLIHALVIEIYGLLGLTPTLVHPLIMVPAFVILVYATSHLAVSLLRRIPYIGKSIT